MEPGNSLQPQHASLDERPESKPEEEPARRNSQPCQPSQPLQLAEPQQITPQETTEVKTPNEPFQEPKESPSTEPIFEAEFEDNFEFKPETKKEKETPEQEAPPAEPVKEKPKLTEKELKVLRLELENAEYLQLKSLLQAKINSEQFEIVKLKSHVALKNKQAEGAQSAKDSKENNTPEEQELKQRLIKENALLEQKRVNLINQIFQERVACIQLKIELAMKEILSKS